MRKLPIILGFLAVVTIAVLSSIFIVDERKQALVLQFGQVVREVRGGGVPEEETLAEDMTTGPQGQEIARSFGPGLYFKLPLVQDVVYYEDRILPLDTDPLEVTPIDDRAAARNRFAEDYPDAAVRHCALGADGFDALLALEGGDVGLVHAMGTKALTRRYTHEELAAMIELRDSRSILLRAGEMTLPPVVIRFSDAATRAEALAALGLSAVPVSKAA